jgi:opacity protein-like surface antigen
MVGHPFDRDSVMDRRASSSSVAGGALAAPLGALAQQQDKAWRIGSFHFGSRQSSMDIGRHGAVAQRSIPTCSKFKFLAMAGITGLVGLWSQAGESEELADDANRWSEQSEVGLGLNVFGLSLHTDRSAGHNEVNPGVGLRYVFWQPAPRWALFGETSIYYDSSRHWAKYVALGTSYRFAEHWRVGAAIAYGQSRSYNDGKPFVAVVPGLGFEHRGVVYNAVLLPSGSGESRIAGLGLFVTIPLGHRD